MLLGPDLKLDNGQLVVSAEECVDPGLAKYMQRRNQGESTSGDLIDQAIRNIYYILMTRAKYCVYIYAVDPDVQRWLKSIT